MKTPKRLSLLNDVAWTGVDGARQLLRISHYCGYAATRLRGAAVRLHADQKNTQHF
jgi:hypothetical protein